MNEMKKHKTILLMFIGGLLFVGGFSLLNTQDTEASSSINCKYDQEEKHCLGKDPVDCICIIVD